MVNKKRNLNQHKNLFKYKKRNLDQQKNLKKKNSISFTKYLHRNKKSKVGIFLKKPSSKEIIYPFFLNLKLINEYLKKK